jgi:hypothetical protein
MPGHGPAQWGHVLGNHDVDLPSRDQILGLPDRLALGQHAAGLLTEVCDDNLTFVNVP